MKHSRKILALIFIIAGSLCLPLLAGTLDHAPFQLSIPDAEWKLDDAKSHPLEKNVSIASLLVNEKKGLISMVITGPINPVPNALDQICEGIRDGFSNPALKKLSDVETTYLGFKAQALTYEMTQDGKTSYNEARVFIVGKVGWTISFSGPLAEKEAVLKMLSYYQPKKD